MLYCIICILLNLSVLLFSALIYDPLHFSVIHYTYLCSVLCCCCMYLTEYNFTLLHLYLLHCTYMYFKKKKFTQFNFSVLYKLFFLFFFSFEYSTHFSVLYCTSLFSTSLKLYFTYGYFIALIGTLLWDEQYFTPQWSVLHTVHYTRDAKMYERANNVCVKKILSQVKSLQNVTLFCQESE